MAMFGFLGFVAAWVAAGFGYSKSRSFVRNRLRYVDGVHNTLVPLKVGVISALAAMPVALLLPFITGGAAILFGTAVGFGVAAGRKDIRMQRSLR